MFEERFIAFVDILGFKEIVKKAKNDINFQNDISAVLNYIAKIRNDNYHGYLSKYGIYNDVSVFSDSIVISYPCNCSDGAGLFHLLMDLIFMCFDLINHGIYVRGGITVGEIIHDQNISWGPAFIAAYELEENQAVYPRIIVDKNAIEIAKAIYKRKFPYDKDGDYLDKLIALDEDGIYYLDYLSQYSEFDDISDYIICLKLIRENIVYNIQNSSITKIKDKYDWFAKYFNRTIANLPFTHNLKNI